MACKATAAARVQWAASETCITPCLLGNVFFAGQSTREAELHRPSARTAATVAGLLPALSKHPSIVVYEWASCLQPGVITEKLVTARIAVYATGLKGLPVAKCE
jgi:hypothetical protein